MTTISKTMIAAVAGGAVALWSAGLAQAGETVTRTGPKGGTATVTWTDNGGSVSRHVDTVGPEGATRSATVTCGKGLRLCGSTATGAGPKGRTWTRRSASVHGPVRTGRASAVVGPAGNAYGRVVIRRR